MSNGDINVKPQDVPPSNPYSNVDGKSVPSSAKSIVSVIDNFVENGATIKDININKNNPVLALPEDASSQDLISYLQSLVDKLKILQTKTAQEVLKGNKALIDQNHLKAQKLIDEALKKAQDVLEKDKANSILKWITQAFSVFAALVGVAFGAVATFITGGAAAPLLVMAGVGLMSALTNMGDAISAELHPNDPDRPVVNLGTWLAKAVSETMIAMGVSKKDAENWGDAMTGLMSMASGGALLVLDPSIGGRSMSGIAKLFGADDQQAAIVNSTFAAVTAIVVGVAMAVLTCGGSAVKAMVDMPQFAMRFAEIMQASAAIGQGLLGVSSGTVSYYTAIDQKEADDAKAKHAQLQAFMTYLQGSIKVLEDEINKLIGESTSIWKLVADMISATASTNEGVIKNMKVSV